MAKRKKNAAIRLIVPVVVALLLTAAGYRAVARWKPALLKRPQRSTPRQSAERFRALVMSRSDGDFVVKPGVVDSIAGLTITDYRGRSLVLANLALLRQAQAYGLDLLAAAEDRKRQSLELVYGSAGRPLLAIAIRNKQRAAGDIPVARPRLALVGYGISGADKGARAALAKRPEIRTLIVDRPVNSAGRELLVALPLEPIGYPKEDPGPGTILLDDSESRIGAKLTKCLRTVSRPAGFAAEAGSRALKDKRITALVTRFCADNKLVFLEPRFTANSLAREQAAANGCAYLTATVFIENRTSAKAAGASIRTAILHARRTGAALLMLPARADVLAALGAALTKEVLAEFEFVGISQLGGK